MINYTDTIVTRYYMDHLLMCYTEICCDLLDISVEHTMITICWSPNAYYGPAKSDKPPMVETL